MIHNEPQKEAKNEYKVVSGIRVVEEEIEIKRPVFIDVNVERPKFVDIPIQVPTGFDAFAKQAGEMIANVAMDHIIRSLEDKLNKAVTERVKEIQSPRIIERIEFVNKEVIVEKPIFKDVEVSNAVVKNVEVSNAVIKDVQVLNAVVKDIPVINAQIEDRVIVNPIFKDIQIDRPVYKDKEIVVIHPKYIDLQGREVKP
jgi:hypothetical protein